MAEEIIETEEEILTPIKSFLYQGSSMNPVFFDGDLVDIGVYDSFEDIKLSDIVVTKQLSITGNKHVIHRVVEITAENKIKTKGDNNGSIDTWELSFEDIEGKCINADRPKRIQRKIVYNQYCKQDREIVQQITEETEAERQGYKDTINTLNEELQNSPEYTALFESEMWANYLSAMADISQLEENYEAGLITEEELETAKEIFRPISESVMNSEVYISYHALPQHGEIFAENNKLTEFEYNIIRIEHDSPEARTDKIVGFPVMILTIPEYLDWNSQVIAESKKLYHKISDRTKISLWEDAWRSKVKNLIGTEKLNV